MDGCHRCRIVRCLEKTVMQARICLMLGLPIGSTSFSLHLYSLLIQRTKKLRTVGWQWSLKRREEVNGSSNQAIAFIKEGAG